ncbi:MAG: phosphoribosylformylglycinamidine cyclo-ligase [Bdellovibrionales bacterium]|nr:phosphoribosylformylglycinamidine cyclo-ligase [Bdellovibrionales bacterium]
MDYRKSGVDICRAEELVDWMKRTKSDCHQDKVISGIGGYASIFKMHSEMKEPCLVSCTDGVGTKLLLALKHRSLKSLGQDLVAMCVNDLVCTGAQPLFFLDYYACGQLNPEHFKELLTGIREACQESECALVGGETAEMPGVYQKEDFDCAGFVVGVVDRPNILKSSNVKKGDVLLALPSSGFHSNGYSLLRKVFEKDMDKWSEELLKPTSLYVKACRLMKGRVHALAHITGGGLDNILRVSPEGSQVELIPWSVPEPFLEVKNRTGLNWEEMLKTFNCGVGMAVFCDPQYEQALLQDLKTLGIEGFKLGELKDISSKASSWALDFNTWDKL